MSIQAKFNGKIQSIGKLIHLAVITHKRSWHDHYLQYLTTSKRYSSRHKYRDINRQQDWLIRLQINRNSYTQIRINRTRCWFDKTEHTTTSCIWTHTPITYSTTIQYNTVFVWNCMMELFCIESRNNRDRETDREGERTKDIMQCNIQ